MRIPWIVVGLLWVVALLNYLDRQLVTTMPGPIKADLKINDAQFGAFSLVFLWVYGICSPIAGYVADRFGCRRVILFSLAIWSLATFMTGYVRTFEEMLVARAVMGISEAFYIPAALALIVEYHQGSTRSRATGLHLSGTYFGSIIGGLGGWMAETQGWQFGFRLFGIVGVGYALLLTWALPHEKKTTSDGEATPEPVKFKEVFAALLGNRSFLILLLMNAAMGAAYWPLKNWLPSFFSSEMGINPKWAGLYGISTFYLATFIGMLLAGTISDRWAMSNPRARMLIPGIAFCLVSPSFFIAGFAPIVPVLLVAVIVVGAGQGALDANLMPSVCLVADIRHRATGYGMLNFVGTTTGGLMTFVGGWLKDQQVSFGLQFQFASGFILLAGVLLFFVRPARRGA